jgi:acyl dehydratase
MLIDLFGVGWLSNGTLDLRFVRQVPDGAVVAPVAEVQELDEQGKVSLAIRCEDQHGNTVMTGTATGRL